jgi:hypothetical protein
MDAVNLPTIDDLMSLPNGVFIPFWRVVVDEAFRRARNGMFVEDEHEDGIPK